MVERGGGKTKKGRRRLSVEKIVAAAVRIADAEGLESVSIRRVAAEIGAPPMSLYGHISNKDDLLSYMADDAVGDMLLEEPFPDHWREAVAEISRRMYVVFVTRPWAHFLSRQQPRFRANGMKLAEQMASAVEGLSLEPAEMWLVLGTVNDYVLGHSVRANAQSKGMVKDISKSDVEEFPELAELRESLLTRDSVERFEAGLQIVLDGVERRFLNG